MILTNKRNEQRRLIHMTVQYSYITLKQNETKPYQINIIAEVNDNGFYYTDTIGTYCFYDKQGRVELEDGTRKIYKRLSALLTLIYTIDPCATMHQDLIDTVKAEAKQMKQSTQVEVNEVTATVEEVQEPAQTKEEINKVNNETILETIEQTFTAYNRSFSSYNEAYEYCIQSDFDPDYIVTGEPEKASQTSTIEEYPELFYLYSNTFSTYWDAYNHAIKNRMAIDMIISSKAAITNEQLLKLKNQYVSSKYSMSYEDVVTYYNHVLTLPNNLYVDNILYNLKSLKERHETRIEAEKKKMDEITQTIIKLEELTKELYSKGMTKKENGYSTKYYINEECVYTQFGSIKVLDLYNDMLQVYNSHFDSVSA